MTKRALSLSFITLGFVSVVAQVVILRELTVNFYGNEFFIGLTLAFWLVWVAAGSGMARLALGWSGLAMTASVLLFLEIFLIRYLKGLIGFPGEIPNLLIAVLAAIFLPSPLCFILGLWWTSASSLAAKVGGPSTHAVNKGYFLETLGFILGGIVFSFLLVKLPAFLTTALLALLILTVITWLLGGRLVLPLKILVSVLLVLAGGFCYLILPNLEKISVGFGYRNQKVLETVNSPYGQIAVAQMGQQKNYYESGLLLGPDNDTQTAEVLTHIPLLEHPSPKKVLLLGGGFNGALNEILKHNVEKIYYLELDPALISLARRHLPPVLKSGLNDPKVSVINTDGRYFLQEIDEKFDVIIINLPDPSTALINRYYTREFFTLASHRLTKDGIFSLHVSFAPDQPTQTLSQLNASVYNALANVFSQIITLPQETNFLLAGNGSNLTYDPDVLLERFHRRGIKNQFVIANYINYLLTNDRISQALYLFEQNKTVRKNEAFRPAAYFYNTLFWLDHFHPKLSRTFALIAQNFWPIAIFVMVILIFVIKRINLREGVGGGVFSPLIPVLSVAAAGFSLMACEIVIIFVYQTIVGYLYYRLALLISALMAGMALGVWLGNKKLQSNPPNPPLEKGGRVLIKLHLLLISFSAILFIVLVGLKSASLALAELALPTCAVLAGLLGAIIFPLANHLYLAGQTEPAKKTGVIYSADLAGSAMGAILPSLILLPIFGVGQALLFVGVVNLWVILLISKDLRSEDV